MLGVVLGTSSPPLFFDGGGHCELARLKSYRKKGAEVRVVPIRRLLDVWHVVDDYYGQAVGKLHAESMMSIAASLFPQ
jgi:hypothetical protein